MTRALAALLALMAAAPAALAKPSDQSFAVELRAGPFAQHLDGEAGLGFRPAEKIFGNGKRLLMAMELDWQLFHGFGSFGLGLSAGYTELYGHGYFPDQPTLLPGTAAEAGTPSQDSSSLHLVPMRLLGVYRFDVLAEYLGIPFVPYGKAGLAYTLWWANNGRGAISVDNGYRGRGGKWGFQVAAGLMFQLDFLDPLLARNFDEDYGVNHSYLFAEVLYSRVDNFGGKGFDLGDGRSYAAGVAIEF